MGTTYLCAEYDYEGDPPAPPSRGVDISIRDLDKDKHLEAVGEEDEEEAQGERDVGGHILT